MPFLHWGTETILKWRNEKIEKIDILRQYTPNGPIPPPYDTEDSQMFRFYTRMMAVQLFSTTPLHIRRTLDQFYYTHTADTNQRDSDQVVSKYGTEPDKKGERVMLVVDQLWLWI